MPASRWNQTRHSEFMVVGPRRVERLVSPGRALSDDDARIELVIAKHALPLRGFLAGSRSSSRGSRTILPSLSRMSPSVQSDGLPRRSVASRAFFKSAKRFLRINLRPPSLRPRKCSWRWPLVGWRASRSANAISALFTSSVIRRSSSIDRAAATALSKPSALSTASAQSNSRRLRSVSARAWASAFGGGVGIGSLIGSTMSPSFHSQS